MSRLIFTTQEKEFIFDMWKTGTGFSGIAKVLDSKPGTIFAIFSNIGGKKPEARRISPLHLSLTEQEEI